MIFKVPCEDGVVDCVISNGVINLCSDKTRVYEEVFRVLKPGTGRFAIADVRGKTTRTEY